MKRFFRLQQFGLVFVCIIMFSVNAQAEFGMVWTDFDTQTLHTNTVGDSTPDPIGAQDVMLSQYENGIFAFAFNDDDNSVDPFTGTITHIQRSTLNSALSSVGGDDWTVAGSVTNVGATAEEFQVTNGGGNVANTFIRFRWVNGPDSGDVIIELSDDNKVSWTQVSGTTTYDYWYDYINLFSANSEAASQSRQEKAKASSRLTSKMVSTRVMNVFSPKPKTGKALKVSENQTNPFVVGYRDSSGLSAGDNPYEGIGVWGMGSYASVNVTKSGAKSDGNVGLFMLGFDKLLMQDRLVVGLGAGYENSWSKIKTSGRSDNGEGLAITPYAAYQVNDSLLVKGVLNMAFNGYDAGNGGQDYEGVRSMGDVSGEYSWLLDNWLLAAEIGYLYLSEDFNRGYEDIYLSESRVSGKAGYEFDNGFLPYFRGTYYRELGSSSAPGWEKGSLEAALGLDYGSGPWTISAELFDNFNGDQETLGGSALIRYEF